MKNSVRVKENFETTNSQVKVYMIIRPRRLVYVKLSDNRIFNNSLSKITNSIKSSPVTVYYLGVKCISHRSFRDLNCTEPKLRTESGLLIVKIRCMSGFLHSVRCLSLWESQDKGSGANADGPYALFLAMILGESQFSFVLLSRKKTFH